MDLRLLFTEQNRRRRLHAREHFRAVHQRRHGSRQCPLRRALGGIPGLLRHEARDLRLGKMREQFQVSLDVAIVRIDPGLIELVRRRELGVEIDRSLFRLAELFPRGHRHQRCDEPVCLRVLDAPDQIHARRDVPPLVAAADLERALALAKQVQEVVGLEQHVAELGERQPRFESRLHRLLLQHDVHREVLADVAQEIDHALLDQPLGVVQQQRGRGTGAEFQKPRGLVAHAMHVLADFFLGEQRALARLPRGIADQAGPAAHQHDRPMAGALQIGEQHQRHEIAELQRGCRRVEAAVGGDRSLGEMGGEAGRPLLDEASPLQFLQHVRLCHGGESIALLGCYTDGFTDTPFAAPRRRRISPPVLHALVVRSRPAAAGDHRHRARPAVRQRAGLRLVDARLRRRPLPQHHAHRSGTAAAAPDLQGICGRWPPDHRVGDRAPHRRSARPDPRPRAPGIPGHGRQALLPPPRDRLRAAARSDAQRLPRVLHDHPAARAERLQGQDHPRTLARPEAAGSPCRVGAGAQFPEGHDSPAVPESDQPRPQRGGRRSGVAGLLWQVGARYQRRRSGDARRSSQGPGDLQSPHASRQRDLAPQRRAHADAQSGIPDP